MTHNAATPPVGLATHPPTQPPACTMTYVQQFYSSSTTAAARTAPDQPTHPPNHPSCTATQQHIQHAVPLCEYVHAEFVAASPLLDFHVYDLPPCRGSGTGLFDAPFDHRARVSSLVGARPFAECPCAAVRGGRGTTTTAAARTASHPPTHPTTHNVQRHSSTYSSSSMFLHRIEISMYLRSPATISGTGDGFFRRLTLAEFGVGARSFADKILCRRVGRARHGRAAGDRWRAGELFQSGGF